MKVGWPLALMLAVVAGACGGAAAPVAPPPAAPAPFASTSPGGTQVPAAVPSAPGGPGEAPPVATAPSPGASGAPLSPSEPAVEMKPPVETAFGQDLRALGVDMAHPPALDHLDARALRGVMKLFARSLGVRCGDCHVEGDFAAPTPRKKIATHMWNEFVARLTLHDGSPLFCDSCHQGRTKLLDRRDKKALGQWMDDHFVGDLARADGRSNDCETCHVDMEMHLLATWTR